MRVLVVGGGGREHALCAALRRSPRLTRLYAAPGNAGIADLAECIDIAATDVVALADFAEREKIDVTVVGPESALVAGIGDRFAARGLKLFGPDQRAAEIEGSKSFTKDLCRKFKIPTAASWTFTEFDAARRFLDSVLDWPVVVKADGLAAGKGVVIARELDEALAALDRMMVAREFGDAGRKVVIEEFLKGVEASVIAIVDGRTIATLETARDHKRAYDHDRGPNTGGMGAVSPASAVTRKVLEVVESEILVPTVHGMSREGRPFKGFLYAGLMLTAGGPKVLEFNCRLGDPETQAILPRLKSDLLELILLAIDGRLADSEPIEWDPRPACSVVLASEGYPGAYATGFPINGLERLRGDPDVAVFHAGTALRNGKVVTTGGRVLAVTALGQDLARACAKAYGAVTQLSFQGAFYRTDIGRAEREPRS